MAKKKLQNNAEQNRSDLNNSLTETAEMQAWSQLTFTCPKCGSHNLLKCLADETFRIFDTGQVVEIFYKREDSEGAEEDDVQDVELVFQREDGRKTSHFNVNDAPDYFSWFLCNDCRHKLTFEDGSAVGEDIELAACLIRSSKKSQ